MSSEMEITVKPEERDARKLPQIKVREPITITIMGATGDLTQRKLIPALFAMYLQDLLPEQFAIVGFARRDWGDEKFRSLMKDALAEHGRLNYTPEQADSFLQHLIYHRADIGDAEGYQRFKERIEADERCPANRLFYLSIKPDLFEPAIVQLKQAGLIVDEANGHWTRVVVEKPFGHDLASALDLNRALRKHLHEHQIYRIDHYLGKETVQNIMSFRFANEIFEPLFNNRYVDHIQITASETVGMESGRGAYYDATGALRDMMQNHILQLLSLATMGAPPSMKADALRNEKVQVLESIAPIRPDQMAGSVVRAQYVGGQVNGEAMPGYVEEERVAEGSMTETFVALRLQIENWRWAGVPIFLRTGKRLRKRMTEIAVQFKTPPLKLFQTVECEGDVCDLTGSKPNKLIFRIQPDEGITIQFSAKRPVLQVQVENVEMDFNYAETWQRSLPEAYERLLLDCMRGDSSLFMRSDEVEAAWRIVDPILQGWQSQKDFPMHTYEAGSWGPSAADGLFQSENRVWRNG